MDFRKRLEDMGRAAPMYALTREGFLMQIAVLLDVLGIDTRVDTPGWALLRIGVSKSVPSSVAPVEHYATPIVVGDRWAKDVVAAAIALLPPGTGRFVLTPEP